LGSEEKPSLFDKRGKGKEKTSANLRKRREKGGPLHIIQIMDKTREKIPTIYMRGETGGNEGSQHIGEL